MIFEPNPETDLCLAWAKTYQETNEFGIVSITYGINVLAKVSPDGDSFTDYWPTWWARAMITMEGRYFPIWIEQQYADNPRTLFREIYADIRCKIQS